MPWPKHRTLANLEKAIFHALMAAGRQLLLIAFAALEEAILVEGEGARQRRRRRYLLTRFGEVRFLRWQMLRGGQYGYPLDEALGIPSKDPCSPWIRATTAYLAQAHPYRQAARLLQMMVGSPVDHRRVWGWAQTSGRRVLAAWERRRAALFEGGELPEATGPAPAIVSTGADGTFIRSRDGPMEVKLGVWWTGAHPVSSSARHPRWVLAGKGYYATTRDADHFGQTFYVLAEERTGLIRAKEVLFVADGAGWLADLPADWIAPTAYQLDHFHGKFRLAEAAKDPDRAARWWAWVAEHNLSALGRSINHYVRSGAIEPKAAASLLHYFERGAGALHTYLRLREAGHSPQMAPRGSGAIEHSVDLVVARRFKRQGMRSWSREGADNLLALRTLAMDPKAWRTWWGDAAW